MRRHIMIDLETLGVGDHAAITQIGLVEFRGHVECQWNIRAEDWAGGIEPQTLLWWLRQGEAARASALDQANAVSLAGAIREVAEVLAGARTLWANSPNFDIRLLRQAYERTGATWPFSFRIERDLRTLAALPGAKDVRPPRDPEKEHIAVEDARHQADWVVAIYKMLGKEL